MSQNSLDSILEKVLRLELRDELRLNQIITIENKSVQLEIENFRLEQRVHDLETMMAQIDIKKEEYDTKLGQNDVKISQLENQVHVLKTKCESILAAKEGEFERIFNGSRGGHDGEETSSTFDLIQMDDIEIDSNNSMDVNTNSSDLEFNENISVISTSFSNPSVSTTSDTSDSDSDTKSINLPLIFFPNGQKKESSEDGSDLTNYYESDEEIKHPF